jgi:hypothetical protein
VPESGGPRPPGFTSAEAHALANEVKATQIRWQVISIRLIAGGSCCVVLNDSRTGEGRELRDTTDWLRLREET